jgi:hypothetical protein
MSHDSLFNHYQTNFDLMHAHHYTLTDLNDMIPYEREIYIELLNAKIREENQKKANR